MPPETQDEHNLMNLGVEGDNNPDVLMDPPTGGTKIPSTPPPEVALGPMPSTVARHTRKGTKKKTT